MTNEISALFDKITSSIEDATTGASCETNIILITKTDLKTITKKNGWNFNWRLEFNSLQKQVYKLVKKDESNVIQGLICFELKEGYIEMHLIETAPHNFGKNKRYIGVMYNLVAFVCKLSFERGFDGVVAFTAKSSLINHYREKLGAIRIPGFNRMVILTPEAKKLVNSYYKNYLL